MKTNFKKITVMALLSASLFAGCKKEQSTNQNSAPAPVSYQVTDRLQVNNEDGKPRPLNTLPVINDEAVALGGEALSSGQVALKNTSGGNLLLKVVANTGENLTLAQTYAAADGFASGTVYYALKNN
jgi:hypothetical protein